MLQVGYLGQILLFMTRGRRGRVGCSGSPCCHGRGPALEWCLPSWLHPGMGQGMAYCGSLLLVGFVEDKMARITSSRYCWHLWANTELECLCPLPQHL